MCTNLSNVCERVCLPVHLPASSQVGYCKHSPKVLHEDDPTCAEVRSDGDIEPSVAIEQSRMCPIKSDTLNTHKIILLYDTCTCMYMYTDFTFL